MKKSGQLLPLPREAESGMSLIITGLKMGGMVHFTLMCGCTSSLNITAIICVADLPALVLITTRWPSDSGAMVVQNSLADYDITKDSASSQCGVDNSFMTMNDISCSEGGRLGRSRSKVPLLTRAGSEGAIVPSSW